MRLGCITVASYPADQTRELHRERCQSRASPLPVSPATSIAAAATAQRAASRAAAYPAANLASFAASDVKSGVTIAGVSGNLASCGSDGATSCIAITSYPAAKVRPFHRQRHQIRRNDRRHHWATSPTALPMVPRTASPPSAYPAAKLAGFAAGDVKSGVTIAGVAGNLFACGADGATQLRRWQSPYPATSLSNFLAKRRESGCHGRWRRR